ncbi:MAG: hypothetical protein E7442_03445 [Ruminococcaceae bacterium]|nr:hypothetical protein [Oscillospiraceae bacterium]
MKRRLSAILPIFLLLLALSAVAGLLLLQRSLSAPEENSPLCITELMCRNTASVTDYDGSYCQWIELKNNSDLPVDLGDYSLVHGEVRTRLPARSIAPGSYILLRQSDWGFPLREDGSLHLLKNGQRVFSLDYVNRSANCSWLAETGRETGQPTPGYEKARTAHKLQISEAMSHNDNCVVKGQLCDWVELYNAGDEAIELGNYWLSKEESEPYASRLPDMTLESGEYTVFCCGSDIDFNLGKSGCVLYLTRSDGVGASALALPAMGGSESFTYDLGIVSVPSPGRENGSAAAAPRGLYISEVLSANDRFLPDEQGEYSDLVELYNSGSETLELSDYYLSDNKSDLFRWALPKQNLEPGAYAVLRCSDGPFALSSTGERLYLTHKDGHITDALILPAIPTDRSWGRRGSELLYFAEPSPGRENGSGQTALLNAPQASVSSGFYETPFTVTLSGGGSIYYSTDGASPFENGVLYEGESIYIGQNTVLRCYSHAGNGIPSECRTYNYFLSQPNYELDVVSVSLAPSDRHGLTVNSNTLEYSANIALYTDGEEQFNLPCGISIFGSGSRIFPKKSYQIDFQSQYGPGKLSYPIFETRNYDDFNSIILRSGSQDQTSAMMRDEVLTSLWGEESEELLTLAYRPVNLYLNGEYEGLYYIRERCSEETVAEQWGVEAKNVGIVKDITFQHGEQEEHQQELAALLDYIRMNDMSDASTFAQVEAQLDIDSTIDFFLSQIWSNNYDIGNARMFRASDAEDPRWHFILYDLDVGFLRDDEYSVQRMVEAYGNLLYKLLENESFRERMTLRLGELLVGPLQEDAVTARVDAMTELIRHDMDFNCRRWAANFGHNGWDGEVETFKSFKNNGISGRSDRLIRQYIRIVQPENELIIRSFGSDYC